MTTKPQEHLLANVSREHAAHNIADGLFRIIIYADEPGIKRAEEGRQMLASGIAEALLYLREGHPGVATSRMPASENFS